MQPSGRVILGACDKYCECRTKYWRFSCKNKQLIRAFRPRDRSRGATYISELLHSNGHDVRGDYHEHDR